MPLTIMEIACFTLSEWAYRRLPDFPDASDERLKPYLLNRAAGSPWELLVCMRCICLVVKVAIEDLSLTGAAGVGAPVIRAGFTVNGNINNRRQTRVPRLA